MVKNNPFACRICGNIKIEPPWDEFGDCPSHNICVCCGVEYGYQDCLLSAIRKYRKEWLEKGANWGSPELKPENWSLEEQIKNIPEQFR